MNVSGQNRQEDVVVDVVETTTNVAFNEPDRAAKTALDAGQSAMAATPRTEPVRTVPKAWFVVGIEEHAQCLLNQPVGKVRDTERTCFAVSLWDVDAPNGVKAIAFLT